MSPEAIDFYAKKYFPHLTPIYGRLSVQAALDNQRVVVAVPRRRKSPLQALMLMSAILSIP